MRDNDGDYINPWHVISMPVALAAGLGLILGLVLESPLLMAGGVGGVLLLAMALWRGERAADRDDARRGIRRITSPARKAGLILTILFGMVIGPALVCAAILSIGS